MCVRARPCEGLHGRGGGGADVRKPCMSVPFSWMCIQNVDVRKPRPS